MKLSLAVTPFEPSQLQLAAQLGVQEITYYNMQGMPMTFRELSEAQTVAQDNGVSIAVVERGPPSIIMFLAARPETGNCRLSERLTGHGGKRNSHALLQLHAPNYRGCHGPPDGLE